MKLKCIIIARQDSQICIYKWIHKQVSYTHSTPIYPNTQSEFILIPIHLSLSTHSNTNRIQCTFFFYVSLVVLDHHYYRQPTTNQHHHDLHSSFNSFSISFPCIKQGQWQCYFLLPPVHTFNKLKKIYFPQWADTHHGTMRNYWGRKEQGMSLLLWNFSFSSIHENQEWRLELIVNNNKHRFIFSRWSCHNWQAIKNYFLHYVSKQGNPQWHSKYMRVKCVPRFRCCDLVYGFSLQTSWHTGLTNNLKNQRKGYKSWRVLLKKEWQ